MLNRYPLWKYLMLIVVILVGLLYALPNIYGEDPAVQITGARGVAASETTLDQVRTVLEKTTSRASRLRWKMAPSWLALKILTFSCAPAKRW